MPGGFFCASQKLVSRINYLVLPLAGVPAGVTPEFAAAALAPGFGAGLVPLSVELALLEGMEEVDELDEVELEGVDGVVTEGDEGVAPVSSTFLPQAPSASRAASAMAVAAAGLNLDASMSVSFYENEKV
jgi:hypothetical protein